MALKHQTEIMKIEKKIKILHGHSLASIQFGPWWTKSTTSSNTDYLVNESSFWQDLDIMSNRGCVNLRPMHGSINVIRPNFTQIESLEEKPKTRGAEDYLPIWWFWLASNCWSTLSWVWKISAPTISSSLGFYVPTHKWRSPPPIEHLPKMNWNSNNSHFDSANICWKRVCVPGSGSSSFSLSFGNAGRSASGYRRNTLYIMRTDFIRRYGLVELIWKFIENRMPLNRIESVNAFWLENECVLTNVMMSFARSRDKSADIKQLSPLSATPASYWFCEFKSLRIIFVANIRSCNHKRKTNLKFD